MRKWNDEECVLQPHEKLQRSQRYIKSLTERRRKKEQPAKRKGSVHKLPNVVSSLRPSLVQNLFQLFADQSTDSYRKSAKRKYLLPPLANVLKVLSDGRRLRQVQLKTDEDENTRFPKIRISSSKSN